MPLQQRIKTIKTEARKDGKALKVQINIRNYIDKTESSNGRCQDRDGMRDMREEYGTKWTYAAINRYESRRKKGKAVPK
jgi:hypothetical protein